MGLLDELRALRPGSQALGSLDDDDLAALEPELEELAGSTGEVILEAGRRDDRIYLVLTGRVALEPPGGASAHPLREEVTAGGLLGMVSFSAGTPAPSTARCEEPTRLAVLTRDRFDALLEHSPDTWRKLELLALERMRGEQLARHLDRLFGPFGPLLPFVLEEVAEHTRWSTLKSGETLYAAGDEADGAYVLLTGRLLAAERSADGERIVGTVLPGETIGEVALLTDRPRAETVWAARDSELVKLSRSIFELMLQRNSKAMYRIARVFVDRLVHRRSQQEASRRPVRTIGLVPADPAAPVGELAEALTRHLAAHGEVRRLSRGSVGRELGLPRVAVASEEEPLHLRLTDWLLRLEERCRFLVYQGDPEWSRWTERCVRQADRLVVVAEAESEPDLAELDARISGPRRRWSLVLIHPAESARPRSTSRWLAATGADSVHHVRRGDEAHLARLARLLSGRATGLVLGGGGARGFAHLGVLRALEELEVPVDLVGGTSIGAPIAAWTAQGLGAEAAQRRARIAFRRLIDPTLPVVSMLHGRRISESIARETGDWEIEDFWLPFFCVSTNLTTSRPVVHTRGDSARAIRASVSIPGVLPPVPENGELLVDGGVVDNLPIAVMRERNPFGRVIAVDLAAPSGPRAEADHGLAVSGWRQLARRLHPSARRRRLPGIGATIVQSMMVGSAQARQRALEENLADLYLNVHVRGVGLLQFDAVDEAAEVGYRQSIEPLRDWLATGGGGP